MFTLSDDVVVNGAKLEDGMLYVDLERIIPDAKKPTIDTQTTQAEGRVLASLKKDKY